MRTRSSPIDSLAIRLLICVCASCGPWAFAHEHDSSGPAPSPVLVPTDGLPNLLLIAPGIYSGGLPAGTEGFAALRSLGIRTMISVDGAEPEVALAAEAGIRYVHLPHGYDGISPRRQLELAKAIVELEKPLYIHCHHGKHRSPAAAAVACVIAGRLPRQQGLQVLELAGTNPNYRGLFRVVRDAVPVAHNELKQLAVDFQPTSPVSSLVKQMIAIDEHYEALRAWSQAKWRVNKDQGQSDPLEQSLLLREQFTEWLRIERMEKRESKFRELALESESAAREIEEVLQGLAGLKVDEPARERLDRSLERLSTSCISCHQRYRDAVSGQ